MWICDECREKNDDENYFCDKCGTARSVSAAADKGGKKETGIGKWKCECGETNESDYGFCQKCSRPKPRNVSEIPQETHIGSGRNGDAAANLNSRYKGGGKETGIGKWKCECGEINESDYGFCQKCGRPKPKYLPKTPQEGHTDSGKGGDTAVKREPGNTGGGKETGMGLWKCECGNVNKSDVNYCTKCRKPKPKIAPVTPNEPPNKTLIICITAVIIALIILAAVIISSKSKPTGYQPPVSSYGHTAVTHSPTPTLYKRVDEPESEQWGEWSAWSTTPRYASATVQVEQRETKVVNGYWMDHYGTQEAKSPHYRMFRNYSIKDELDKYGARTSYGEKHLTKYITIDQVSKAVAYPANGEFITISYGGETYSGYQMGTSTAYNFGDDKYVWFIESEDAEYITEYRYRERK